MSDHKERLLVSSTRVSASNVFGLLERFPGNRVLGSREEQETVHLIVEDLRHADVRPECVDFTYYLCGPTSLKLVRGGETIELESGPHAGTGPIHNEEFTRILVLDENAGRLPPRGDAEGHRDIVLTEKKLGQELVTMLKSANLNTFIQVARPGRSVRYKRAFTSDPGETSPLRGIVVTLDTANVLLEKPADATLLINSEASLSEAKGTNVVVNEAALRRPSGGIVVTAHLDSVLGSPGVGDNAVACAILVELCKEMMHSEPDHNICFVWTTGEEVGLLGMSALCERWANAGARVRLGIVLDALGGGVSKDQIVIANREALEWGDSSEWRDFESREPCEVTDDPNNDGTPLAALGVPVISLYRFTGFMHCPEDSLRSVTKVGVAKSVCLVERVLQQVIILG